MLEERDVTLQEKNSAIEKLKNSLLSSYAEMENVRARNRKEMENARRFAVQVRGGAVDRNLLGSEID